MEEQNNTMIDWEHLDDYVLYESEYGYLIVYKPTNSAKIIEDNQLALSITKRMIEKGVKIIRE